MERLADKTIFWIIVCMIAFPYTKAILPGLGEVNVKSTALLVLLFLVSARILSGRNSHADFLLLYSFAVFILYGCISILLGRQPVQIAYQIFDYAPFLISCLLISSGTTVPHNRAFSWILFAVALSGALAAYIFYFDPQWMPVDSVSDADFSWGRLPWRNGFNVLIFLVLVFFYTSPSRAHPIVILLVVVGFVAAILTFNRTFLVASFAVIVTGFTYGVRQGNIYNPIRVLSLLLIAGLIGSIIFNFEGTVQNFESRIIGTLLFSSDISGHIEDRLALYEQYFDVFSSYPLFGAGLGVPFATFPYTSFYADVTLVSFYLPFGVFGIGMFGVYLAKMFSLLRSVQSHNRRVYVLGFRIIIVLALFVSLNDDIWSHKEFSIILTFLIVSLVRDVQRKQPWPSSSSQYVSASAHPDSKAELRRGQFP